MTPSSYDPHSVSVPVYFLYGIYGYGKSLFYLLNGWFFQSEYVFLKDMNTAYRFPAGSQILERCRAHRTDEVNVY